MWLLYIKSSFLIFSLGRKDEEKLLLSFGPSLFVFRPWTRSNLEENFEGCMLSLGRRHITCDRAQISNSKFICCVYSLGRINKTDLPTVWLIVYVSVITWFRALVAKTLFCFFTGKEKH